MNMRWMAVTLVSLGVALVGTSGCAAAPKTLNDVLTMVDKGVEVAVKNGASWQLEMEFTGDPKVYHTTAFGLDTGVTAKIHIQGNAQTAGSESDQDDLVAKGGGSSLLNVVMDTSMEVLKNDVASDKSKGSEGNAPAGGIESQDEHVQE